MTVPTVSASSERDTACQSTKKNGVVSANSANAAPSPITSVRGVTRLRSPERAIHQTATSTGTSATMK